MLRIKYLNKKTVLRKIDLRQNPFSIKKSSDTNYYDVGILKKKHTTNQLISNKSTYQLINQPTNQLTNQQTDKSVNKYQINLPTSQSTN